MLVLYLPANHILYMLLIAANFIATSCMSSCLSQWTVTAYKIITFMWPVRCCQENVCLWVWVVFPFTTQTLHPSTPHHIVKDFCLKKVGTYGQEIQKPHMAAAAAHTLAWQQVIWVWNVEEMSQKMASVSATSAAVEACRMTKKLQAPALQEMEDTTTAQNTKSVLSAANWAADHTETCC